LPGIDPGKDPFYRDKTGPTDYLSLGMLWAFGIMSKSDQRMRASMRKRNKEKPLWRELIKPAGGEICAPDCGLNPVVRSPFGRSVEAVTTEHMNVLVSLLLKDLSRFLLRFRMRFNRVDEA
jgi:hypothetical protein